MGLKSIESIYWSQRTVNMYNVDALIVRLTIIKKYFLDTQHLSKRLVYSSHPLATVVGKLKKLNVLCIIWNTNKLIVTENCIHIKLYHSTLSAPFIHRNVTAFYSRPNLEIDLIICKIFQSQLLLMLIVENSKLLENLIRLVLSSI